jgi:glutamine amidotransferase
MITIIDYGVGNLGSIVNMLSHLDYDVTVSGNISDIQNASHLILPGVGHFDYGMRSLHAKGVDEAVLNEVKKGKPLLGICLGAQLLLEGSEEGDEKGLGLIEGSARYFDLESKPVPHIGWASLETQNILFDNMDEDRRFYFVHSYYLSPKNKEDVLCSADYEHNFASGIQHDNVTGVQFHPEKSHKYGMKFFENYFGEVI